MVDMIPITSTAISAVGYDEDSKTLTIQFKKRGTYTYDGVPKDIYDLLIAEVESAGQLFNWEIKPYYPGRQATIGQSAQDALKKQITKAVTRAALTAITKVPK